MNGIEVSISKSGYKEKPNDIWGIEYQRKTVGITELVTYLVQGHSICGVFKDEEFGQKRKMNENFLYSWIIPVDIDNSEVPMREYLKNMKMLPTIAYETFNNGINGYRFRLLYIFNKRIEGEFVYRATYRKWCDIIGVDKYDTHMVSPSLNVFGSKAWNEWEIHPQNIYDVPEVSEDEINAEMVPKRKRTGESIIKDCSQTELEAISDTFLSDLDTMDTFDFISLYRANYEYFTHSNVEYKDGFADMTDYVEIKRRFVNAIYETKDGDKIVKEIPLIKDGQMRRHKMFIAAMVMKRIKPDITIEHLIYNLVCERFYHYDNSDGVITNCEIIRIANEAMLRESTIKPNGRYKFKVDKEYWANMGITPQGAVQIIKGMKKDEEIGNLYNVSNTDKVNVQIMKENGLNISIATLKRWKDKNGLTKKRIK